MKMPKWADRLSRFAWALLWAPIAVMLFIGVSIFTIGIFLGCMTVLGMWLTVERLPGVRQMAKTQVGILGLSIGAAFLVHLVIGTATATGMIAAAVALVVKYFLLSAEAEADANQVKPSKEVAITVLTPSYA